MQLTFIKVVGYKMRAMLRKLLRLGLVALLACSIPVQGLAALSIDVCETLAHDDGHMQAAAAHGHATGGESTQDGQNPAHEAAHHAASCGAVAAIIATVKADTADTPSDGVRADSLPTPEGFVPDRPERPPLKLSV